MKFCMYAIAILLFCAPTQAAEWTLSKGGQLETIDPGPQAEGGLPDGHVMIAEDDSSEILAAWYMQPTTRYRHAILGDGIEAGALTVEMITGKKYTHVLPDNQVFEDRTPRVVDFEGFGKATVVTILSDVSNGAALAVFGIVEDELKLLARTPFIGRSNRWRNIAGIADFDGDGSLQIAEVVTPHIGGTLRFWTWRKGELVPSGSMAGFSNHGIGEREQALSVVDDFNGDGVSDIALPSADRRALRIIAFSGAANGKKTLKQIAEIPLPSKITRPPLAEIFDGKFQIILSLQDGSVWTARQP